MALEHLESEATKVESVGAVGKSEQEVRSTFA